MALTAEDFDAVHHLGALPVSYPPRDINTEAIQVLPENIGALTVEFHEDLRYEENGRPYFIFVADRTTDEDPDKPPAVLRVCLDYWIVVLWGQLHVFRDFEFKSTFNVKHSGPQHQLSVDDSAMSELERLEVRSDGALRGIVHDEVTQGDLHYR